MRIGGAGGDHDRLVGGRQQRGVFHIVHGGAGVRDTPAVDHAGRAKPAGQRHPAVRFRGAAVQAQQQLRVAPKPLDFSAQRDDTGAWRNGTGERRRENAVRLVVSA